MYIFIFIDDYDRKLFIIYKCDSISISNNYFWRTDKGCCFEN